MSDVPELNKYWNRYFITLSTITTDLIQHKSCELWNLLCPQNVIRSQLLLNEVGQLNNSVVGHYSKCGVALKSGCLGSLLHLADTASIRAFFECWDFALSVSGD